MAELGRRSGEVRRERALVRRTRDAGIIAWDVLHEDPEAVFRRVFAGGNSVAIMDAIRFATEGKAAQLKAREVALEERERELRDMERSRAEYAEWEAEAQARYDAVEAELYELERRRDELRADGGRAAGRARRYEEEGVAAPDSRRIVPSENPGTYPPLPADEPTPAEANGLPEDSPYAPPEEYVAPLETDAFAIAADPSLASRREEQSRSSETGHQE